MRNKLILKSVTGAVWVGATIGAWLTAGQFNGIAQLPPDFPGLTVTTYDTNAVGDGYIFLEVTDSSTNDGNYLMVLDNSGSPVWYQSVTNHSYDFKVLPNGYLHYASIGHTHSWTDGGDCSHSILDDGYNPEETITAGNGYVADTHDFQLLPNGHVLLDGYYLSPVDMSKYVEGGYPNALVAGAVIQELDAERNVVFQWRPWDHFTVPTYFPPQALTNGAGVNPVVDAFHIDTVIMDTDGNLLISDFGMGVSKISRQTGQIIWHLGGPANEFTFVGEDQQEAAGHFSGHALSRLDNGDLMIYCNADQQATRSSKVYEYSVDETYKTATLVWSYAPPTNYYAWHYGSAQRLPNGNTLIGWGSANIVPGVGGTTHQWIPACTEVSSNGTVVFELRFNDPKIASYRAYRVAYPPGSQAQVSTVYEPADGNTYSFDPTGISITLADGGGGYTGVTATREPYAPINPQFPDAAPRVLPLRVSLSDWGIYELDAELDFDCQSFGFADPASLTVYYRPETGDGEFLPQTTAYDPGTHSLAVMMTMFSPYYDLGEFIFCYPDLAEVPNPPVLAAVESYRGVQSNQVVAPLPASSGTSYSVNQQLPACLAWSPEGLAQSYHLQIATDTSFSNLVVDVPYQTQAFYVLSNAVGGTAYSYRVNTSNTGGTSEWANGSFQTVADIPRITAIQQIQPGDWVLQWSGTSTGVYVEFNPALTPDQWQTIAGPVVGSAWTNTSPATAAGFYRLRLP